jgi:tetratricopeptide (TPR) repeat protein
MKYDITLERIANCYYNLGLERARLRDLSGACELLKKALLFDKYQKDARNLLGLIFFECGETADALCQWVISMNLLPENNIADHYLDEIQRKPAILRVCSDNVQRFNQALDYAQNNNKELAIMQLNQVIKDSPNYIKAHILLALLYMDREEWVKAGRSLYTVLKIDRNNPKALVLMDEVKQNTGRKEVEQNRLKNAFSHMEMTDDLVVMPQEVKQISPWAVLGLIVSGIVLAVFAFYFLIMPAKTKSINAENNKELITYTEKLDAANRQYDDLKAQYDTLASQYAEAANQLDQYENQNAAFMTQYETLNKITSAYNSGDLVTAAGYYVSLDQSQITDEGLLAQLQDIKNYMEGSVYQTLADEATADWNSGKKDEAVELYTLSVEIREEPVNMYLLARLLQSMGNTQEASIWFDKIVGEHPDSPYAARARNARGY